MLPVNGVCFNYGLALGSVATMRLGFVMLYHLGYVSTETSPFTSAELKGLLAKAFSRNKANEITGLLLHRDDSFYQVLEGNQESVLQIFSSIQRDNRHHRIELLFQGPLVEREFGDWRMGFVDLDGVEVDQLPGFSDFLHSDAEPRIFLEELSHAKRLMLLFRAMQ